MTSAVLSTPAYLLQNRANANFTKANLELTDTRLRCTLSEYAGWIDNELAITDYKARLSSGEPVVAFDFDRDQLAIKWLWQFYRGGFQVRQGNSRTWLVSLIYPSGVLSVMDLFSDGQLRKRWREALPTTRGVG